MKLMLWSNQSGGGLWWVGSMEGRVQYTGVSSEKKRVENVRI